MSELDEKLGSMFSKAIEEINRIVITENSILETLLIALLSGGHVILEGYIATGKTLLCKTFARVIGGSFSRIQCTPDLLPSDIIGTYIFNQKLGDYVVRKGPIFANIVMVDEIDRANPRTQAAFIEAMQEGQVSIEGRTFPLPEPFILIATRVAGLREEGTFPLPKVTMDRFMFSIQIKRLDPSKEVKLLERIDTIDDFNVRQMLKPSFITSCKSKIRKIFVLSEIRNYIVNLVHAIGNYEEIAYPPSTRAIVTLYKGARARAFIKGRDYVIPDDVKAIAYPALRHRIYLKPEARLSGVIEEDILKRALEEVPVPR